MISMLLYKRLFLILIYTVMIAFLAFFSLGRIALAASSTGPPLPGQSSVQETITGTKTATAANAGQALTYTIRFSSDIAGPILITDSIPAYTQYLTKSITGTTIAANIVTPTDRLGYTMVWTVNNVITKSVITLSFVVVVSDAVSPGQPITNTAWLSDNIPYTMTRIVTVARQADLELTKRLSHPAPVAPGDLLTYTLAFTNNGPHFVSGLVISDDLPAPTLTLLSVLSSGAVITQSAGPPNLAWQVEPLLPGAGGIITLTVKVTDTGSEGIFTNTAVITGPVVDTTTTNNNDQAATELNLPPSANAGGPYTVTEGLTITLNGSATDPGGDDPLSYAWDFNNGGLYDDATGPNPVFANSLDDAVLTLSLIVTDSQGATATAATLLTITNAVPLVEAGPDQTASSGQVVNFSGTFTDTGLTDTHLITWTFGDGGLITGTLTPSYTYLVDGIYTVTLSVLDDDGGLGSDSLLVTVAEECRPPHRVTISGPNRLLVAAESRFRAEVSPITTTTSLSYIWQATAQADVIHTTGLSDTATFSWSATGPKNITVTVLNRCAKISATQTISVDSRSIFLPLIQKPVPPLPNFGNHDFESGPGHAWAEDSTNFENLIINLIEYKRKYPDPPLLVTPHSGNHVAWLGGKSNELSILSQTVHIPAVYTQVELSYWYWIGSTEDDCQSDAGNIKVNDRSVYTYQLCRNNDTEGWQRNTVLINTGIYTGRNITFYFQVELNGTENSNFFLDDVILEPATVAITSLETKPVVDPAVLGSPAAERKSEQ